MPRPIVLVIGGSDSSGGAGIAQDLRVLADCNIGAALAITAVTAQTDAGVSAIHHVPADVLRAQMSAALTSHSIGAIKIGMLGRRETVETVLDMLPPRNVIPIVLDPVHISTSGQALLDPDGLSFLREHLLPRVTLVTPNLPEAAALLGSLAATDEPEVIDQGERIRRLGPDSVLMKGGHANGIDVVDLFIRGAGDVRRFVSRRIPVRMRGTGCALATAITARLAVGATLVDACSFAKGYLFELHAKKMRSIC
jgi:hydroxymethylpyrimidine/phosphomethylpyrimidine kinase